MDAGLITLALQVMILLVLLATRRQAAQVAKLTTATGLLIVEYRQEIARLAARVAMLEQR